MVQKMNIPGEKFLWKKYLCDQNVFCFCKTLCCNFLALWHLLLVNLMSIICLRKIEFIKLYDTIVALVGKNVFEAKFSVVEIFRGHFFFIKV